MILLGVDPALRNLGMAIADYDVYEKRIMSVEKIQLVTTEKGKGKTRRNADDFTRARVFETALSKWAGIADCVIAEMPTGSQSARASHCAGIVLGTLAGLRTPLIQVQPSETKMVVGKNAEKAEIIQWAVDKYPQLPWIRTRGKISPQNEHIADAVAVLTVGVELKSFKEFLDKYIEADGF